jgi:anti-sigma regulatory factor (Ser/Thr protein kinase)
MNELHSIRIGNSMTEVASALNDAANWIEPLQVSAKAQYFLSLAIEELATNWIKYGCPDTCEYSMTFELKVNEGMLTIRVMDEGGAFDPTQVPAPPTDIPAENRAPGGIGIFLMRKMADKMSYERRGSLNILSLEKSTR